MVRWSVGAGVIFACAAIAPGARAQQRSFGGLGRGQTFIAPSGEPFHAPDGAAYPVAAWFARADQNHDGHIDQGEFIGDFMHFFDSLDLDHDDMLSPQEIKRYETEIAPEVQRFGDGDAITGDGGGPRAEHRGSGERGGHGGHGGHGGGGRGDDASGGAMPGQGGDDGGGSSSDDSGPPSAAIGQSPEIERDLAAAGGGGGERFGLIAIPEPVASMDASFSGHVSRGDAMAAAQRRFALLDPDGKGSIAWGDLPHTYAQQRAEKTERRRGRGG